MHDHQRLRKRVTHHVGRYLGAGHPRAQEPQYQAAAGTEETSERLSVATPGAPEQLAVLYVHLDTHTPQRAADRLIVTNTPRTRELAAESDNTADIDTRIRSTLHQRLRFVANSPPALFSRLIKRIRSFDQNWGATQNLGADNRGSVDDRR
jgi:hypothetical protein